MQRQHGGLYWEEYQVGQSVQTPARTITEADIISFAGLTGDYNPLHVDEEFAKTTQHGSRIAHGALTFSISIGLTSCLRREEGTVIAYAGVDIKYLAVVRAGDTIYCNVTVLEKRESKKQDRGIVVLRTDTVNQQGETVLTFDGTLVVQRKP